MEETKIFVVIAVLSTVLIGLATYLFWLDRRISKMEKEIKNNQN
jgi:CcmD family protein